MPVSTTRVSPTAISTLEPIARVTDLQNLYASIDKSNVLNLKVPEDAQAVIKPWDERNDTSVSAQSNVDAQAQIIIHVPFTQNVRVRSVLLELGQGEETLPKSKIHPIVVSRHPDTGPDDNLTIKIHGGIIKRPPPRAGSQNSLGHDMRKGSATINFLSGLATAFRRALSRRDRLLLFNFLMAANTDRESTISHCVLLVCHSFQPALPLCNDID
ncbi:uncharacterized protein PHACADRAFT_196073 [Phanerochaete carnosa HHB-10118-sp]|uniref:PITH domain-containing protein n=1 Tax=Phanerochaete carnosa (strain HHB-10118-sp) TaxID=650164 RepID=K5VWU0_PHACS|nr:uncharacterized protein PHACADRAFT_196073 [Phanerochaete carnosa HHB-10118-sp]EKM56023.1 hypothetical protein PHACADRAFT_196073 [Phanerochaete carnosa HHB-10118-sp]